MIIDTLNKIDKILFEDIIPHTNKQTECQGQSHSRNQTKGHLIKGKIYFRNTIITKLTLSQWQVWRR